MDVAGSLNLHSEAKKMWKGVLAVRGGLGVFIAISPPVFSKEVKSPFLISPPVFSIEVRSGSEHALTKVLEGIKKKP